MAGWNDILDEVKNTPPQFDYVRRKYIKKLSEYTGRNVICYYSGWLTKRGAFCLWLKRKEQENV